MTRILVRSRPWPRHGWLGLFLITLFWPLTWFLPGPRTHFTFFPLWTGLALTLDALVWRRRGSSLFTRHWQAFVGLFVLSAPIWWLFELLNWRTQNWHYVGRELFSDLEYALLASLAFSTVLPAVFEAAELMSTCSFVQRFRHGPRLRPTRRLLLGFFLAGWLMLAVLWTWPRYGFPFIWLSLFFILEPVNAWLGYKTLLEETAQGDWRSVASLWAGVLLCAFFWEFWNYWAFPKWVYTIPFVDFLHIFEMPLLGYGGYLPFALELYALYHLVRGLLGQRAPYLRLAP
ncbi:MAG: hypothetical protein D6759_09995 [Chloroflexi bacterium]|nr:MAG: hypothetical protein D6759_09995 [Chloroflexota bacterium]